MSLKSMIENAQLANAPAEAQEAPPPELAMPRNDPRVLNQQRLHQPPSVGRPFNTLAQRFQNLNNQGLKYAVLSGYEGLPYDLASGKQDDTNAPILILFEPPTRAITGRVQTMDEQHMVAGKDREIVAALGLEKSPSGLDATYQMSLGGKVRDVTLIPKGCGFLPDTFERRILNARQAYNDVVSITDAECTALAMLFHRVHRTKWLDDEPGFKRILAEYVDRRVGNVQTCEIKQFGITLPSKVS